MKPGPKRSLSEEAIVGAALKLLGERGGDAVSMRSIAGEVGVAPNAIYTYFPDKAAVLRAVVDRLIGEQSLDVFSDRTMPWRHRIREVALGLRARLLDHPGATRLLLGAPMDGPRALAYGEKLLDLLAEAGLSEEDAARASYTLIVYLLGSIALEAAELDPAAPTPPEDDRIAQRRKGFEAIPAESFPRTAASVDVMAAYISTDQFLWGLERVLDGLVRD
ncbi:TetR/AcrR family transcriptional regulator [Lentzea nigeriaca]|uniref:TetR/AcrR family transcriptional regulator n=1 Tax=Lentzea nigeriaca TaxID=1128665 RepID=UPI00195BADB7|nr:TetR/AcrR family transcriptional regulator [Lentzea nigeriaca]MBM7862999.1 AcrR family transcriptional regulator [Lentzea nigeriaca]